jgi:hypothetical protein
MILADLIKHPQKFDNYVRPDGEEFVLHGVLYESPAESDIWLMPIVASHKKWGEMRFTLMMPKKFAATRELAAVWARGAPLEALKRKLDRATAAGRDFDLVWPADGWALT